MKIKQLYRPVYQTRFGTDMSFAPKERGNCFAACIGSIIGMNVEDVFQPQEIYEQQDWYYKLVKWLYGNGYEIDYYPNHNDIDLNEFKDVPYIVGGETSIRTSHVCVYKNGILIHDPKPLGDGLISTTEGYTIKTVSN